MKTSGLRCFSPKNILFIFLMILFFTGCAEKIQLSIVNPPEVDTTGIKKVAVGRFEIAYVNYLQKTERNGVWKTERVDLTKDQLDSLSNQIRARVISLLSTTPYFNLVYTDKFAELENDAALQDAIAAGGFKTAEEDAVINGKIWLEVVNTDGVEPDKADLEYLEGGRQSTFNYTLEVIAYWPYKSVSGTLALEMKLTNLNPTDVVAVTFDTRNYSQKIGGKPIGFSEQLTEKTQLFSSSIAEQGSSGRKSAEIEESDLVLPNLDQLVADLAESIAAQFVRRISITQKTVNYPIASGGNKTAKMLIEVGAYEKAISTLTETLNKAEEKDPDDMYNLGLCFEAIGEYGLAAVSYEDANKRDPKKLLYAQGIGRISRLKRENRRLSQ
ncbi:tetratricopeptide repeat protein [bacterium]|nr:tetratricopeptide repeat protein [bacterium]